MADPTIPANQLNAQAVQRLNLAPITHSWAWQHFQDMSANFWTPKERELGQDRADIQGFTEQTDHMFRHALAYLTTSDIQIGDNAEDGVAQFLWDTGISFAPEVRSCISTQAFFERIHSWSYQHILETVLSLSQEEQLELYELWQRVPAMKRKVEYAHEQAEILGDPTASIYERLVAFFFYYCIYEGGWFMTGFNPLFALARFQHKIAGTTDNLRYIRNDETQHVVFGSWCLDYLRRNMPSIWRKAMQQYLPPVISHCYKLEVDWADFLIGTGILGYSAHDHRAHFSHLLNLRCRELAIPIFFPNVAASPVRWLSEFELRPEQNFFEKKVTEYNKGGLTWDE